MRFLVDQNLSPLLADELRGAGHPSVILLRLRTPRPAARLAAVLLTNLGGVAADLAAGAIVVLEDERIRVRRLPVA